MVAGGKPSKADCRYTPRSAASILRGNRSLPTMWIDKPALRFADTGFGALSAMPPLRAADFPLALPLPLPLPLFDPLPLFPAPALLELNASQTAMAIEYVSSPLAQ